MENLNAQNFWNELNQKYPLGMEVFRNWLIQYQRNIGWAKLFRAKYHVAFQVPTYNDIPMAMQIGIWIEFVTEGGGSVYVINLFWIDWKQQITMHIRALHENRKTEIEKDQQS